MKALVLKGYNNLVYEEVPRPVVGADEVLVEVKACGICGSDPNNWIVAPPLQNW